MGPVTTCPSVLKNGDTKSKVITEAIRLRDQHTRQDIAYACHTESPYGDGYGDAGYGDYSDA